MADVAVAERPPRTRASTAASDAGSDHLEDTLGASSLRDGLSDEDFAAKAAKINRRLAYSLTDWMVTEKEARKSFDDLCTMSDGQQAQVLAVQESKGKLDRLFRNLPKSIYTSRTTELLRMYRNVSPEALTQRTLKLLSSGLFTSQVSEATAAKAFGILQVLPQAHRAKVIDADNGKYFERLMKAEEQAKTKDVEPVDVPGAKKPTLARKAQALKVARVVIDGKIDLDDVQALAGGTLGGVLLKDDPDANDIDIDVGSSLSTIDVDIPKLAISAMKQGNVASGAGSAMGIHAKAKWATPDEPTSKLEAKLDTLSIRQLAIGEGDEQTKIDQLDLEAVKLDGTNAPGGKVPPTSTYEAHALVAKEVFKLVGFTLPNLSNLVGPWQSPENLSKRIQQNFRSDMAIDLSVGSVNVAGVTLANGDHVDQARLEGVKMSSERTAYRQQLEKQLAELQGADGTAVAAQRAQLEAELKRLGVLEREQAALARKAEKGALSGSEQERCVELSNELLIGTTSVHADSWTAQGASVSGTQVSSLSMQDLDGTFSGGGFERNLDTKRGRLDEAIARRTGQSWVSGPQRPMLGSLTTGAVDAQGVTHGESGVHVDAVHAAGTHTRLGEQGTTVGTDQLSLSDLTHAGSGAEVSRLDAPTTQVRMRDGGLQVEVDSASLGATKVGSGDQLTTFASGGLRGLSMDSTPDRSALDLAGVDLQGVTHTAGDDLRATVGSMEAGGLRMVTEGIGGPDESSSLGARHITMNEVDSEITTRATDGNEVPSPDAVAPVLQPLAGAQGMVSVLLPILRPVETELSLKVPLNRGIVNFDDIQLDASGLLASTALKLVGTKPIMVNGAGDLILSLRGWEVKLMDHADIKGLSTPSESNTHRGTAALRPLIEAFADPCVTREDAPPERAGDDSEPPLDLGRVQVDVSGVTFGGGVVSSQGVSAKLFEGAGKNEIRMHGMLGEGISGSIDKLRAGLVRAGDTKVGLASADKVEIDCAGPLEDERTVRAGAERITLGGIRHGKKDVFS